MLGPMLGQLHQYWLITEVVVGVIEHVNGSCKLQSPHQYYLATNAEIWSILAKLQ